MFWIYRATRGTNAPYIISGIIMIYLMWVVVRTLNMELLSNILGQFVSVGVIALIIVFQPEIRRFLQMIGMRQKRFNFIARIFNRNDNTSVTIIAPIVQACREMSAHKTGALIVIGRQSDLRYRHRCQNLDAASRKYLLQERTAARRRRRHRRRPHRRSQMHPPRNAERRSQILRYASPGRDRHERNFGRDHSGRFRRNRRHLDRTRRDDPPRHRSRSTGQSITTSFRSQPAKRPSRDDG